MMICAWLTNRRQLPPDTLTITEIEATSDLQNRVWHGDPLSNRDPAITSLRHWSHVYPTPHLNASILIQEKCSKSIQHLRPTASTQPRGSWATLPFLQLVQPTQVWQDLLIRTCCLGSCREKKITLVAAVGRLGWAWKKHLCKQSWNYVHLRSQTMSQHQWMKTQHPHKYHTVLLPFRQQ